MTLLGLTQGQYHSSILDCTIVCLFVRATDIWCKYYTYFILTFQTTHSYGKKTIKWKNINHLRNQLAATYNTTVIISSQHMHTIRADNILQKSTICLTWLLYMHWCLITGNRGHNTLIWITSPSRGSLVNFPAQMRALCISDVEESCNYF